MKGKALKVKVVVDSRTFISGYTWLEWGLSQAQHVDSLTIRMNNRHIKLGGINVSQKVIDTRQGTDICCH